MAGSRTSLERAGGLGAARYGVGAVIARRITAIACLAFAILAAVMAVLVAAHLAGAF